MRIGLRANRGAGRGVLEDIPRDDAPRLHIFSMHFWAADDAAGLARGLKAALDQTSSQK